MTTGFDNTVERLGRWTAARTTRRSFLHRLGQLAMVVAVGPTLATILMKRAEARVCGQTGVTPKCDTFDCVGEGHVWGWCWYASDGCCRNDGLKKICDCCVVNYPNVHGYCPAGTNVACIVESCGEDPRLLDVEISTVTAAAVGGFEGSAIDIGHPTVARRAVVAGDGSPWFGRIAAPLAGVLDAPFLVAGAGGLAMVDLTRLDRLGVRTVMVVGPVSVATTDAITDLGMAVEVVSAVSDPGDLSVAVAERIRSINAIDRAITVVDSGFSAQAGDLAAIFGSTTGFPLLVGDAARATVDMPTVLVGPEPTDPGATGTERTSSTNLVDLARELTELAAATPFATATRVILVPDGTAGLLPLANLGAGVIFHPPGALDGIGDRTPVATWLTDQGVRWGKWTEIFLVDAPGALTAAEFWRLQGTTNGFRVDDLMGVPGEGLPVFRQPLAEREIGMARTDGALPWGQGEQPDYWTSVAQTFRD